MSAVFYINLRKSLAFELRSLTQVSRRTAVFPRRGDQEVPQQEDRSRKYKQGQDGTLLKENLNLLKAKVSLDTKKPYVPPTDVEAKVQQVVEEVLPGQDWTSASLQDPLVKYKVLSKLIRLCGHDVPNTILHNITSVQQVIEHFSREVKTTVCIEDLQQAPDLPPNLHINSEYIRFSPNTDAFHEGRTAFPGQNTYVTSIKYKRKYGDVITDKPKPGFYNRYYGY